MADEKTPSELFIEERQEDTGSRKKAVAAGAGGATSFFLAGMLGGQNSPAADLTVMDRAKEMEAAGKDRDYIWKETWKMGQPWMKHQGTWVFEFSDEGTKQIGDVKKLPPYGAITRSKTPESLPPSVVSEYFEAPGLDVYPELRETSLHGIPARSPKARAIHGPPGGKTPSRVELSNYLNSPEAEEAFLHEMHHLIARKIGLPQGSSDALVEWQQAYTKESFSSLKDFYDKNLFKQIAEDFNFPTYEEFRGTKIQAKKDAGGFIPETWSRNQELAWKDGYKQLTDKLHGEAISSSVQSKHNPNWRLNSPKLISAKRKALLETYQHILGEADARNVAARRNLSWEERGDKPYWETYDRPEEDLLIPSPQGVGQSEELSQKRLPSESRTTDLAPSEEDPLKKQKSRMLPAKVMHGILSTLRRAPGYAKLGAGAYDVAMALWDRLSDKQKGKLIDQVYPSLPQESEEDTDYTAQTDLFGPEHTVQVGGGIDPSSPIVDLIIAGAKQGQDPNTFIEGMISKGLIPEYARDQAYDYFNRVAPPKKAAGRVRDDKGRVIPPEKEGTRKPGTQLFEKMRYWEGGDTGIIRGLLNHTDDDSYALQSLQEIKETATMGELKSVRKQMYERTQKALEDFPEELTVYRYGETHGEEVASFSLNPEYRGVSPAEKRNRIAYTVNKKDILAAPDAVLPGIDYRFPGEDEVIIRGDKVAPLRAKAAGGFIDRPLYDRAV